jgi:hypothetical protein
MIGENTTYMISLTLLDLSGELGYLVSVYGTEDGIDTKKFLRKFFEDGHLLRHQKHTKQLHKQREYDLQQQQDEQRRQEELSAKKAREV